MTRPGDFDKDSLLLGYSSGELAREERRLLLELAAHDQELFDQLMEAESIRQALAVPEERERAAAVLKAWGSGPPPHGESAPPVDAPIAALHGRPVSRRRSLLEDVGQPLLSTVATALILRLSYAAITAVGSALVTPQDFSIDAAQAGLPAPSILHLVHAAIAALLLAIQFTPFLKPQTSAAAEHPIAHRCLEQFIAGWRGAWGCWLALYLWLWLHGTAGARPDAIADVLNCLTSFPLFWCFFVLDKPSVPAPGDPERNAAFRKANGITWGIGAGVAVLAVAGRLHWWGLNEFGLVFMGIYNGLAIAFLVGRFDSHWMKVPRWMLAPLYGYALIQMIYVFFFKLPAEWQVYTYLVALLFKVCLFMVVTHLLHAGNLRTYLEAAEDGKLGPGIDTH